MIFTPTFIPLALSLFRRRLSRLSRFYYNVVSLVSHTLRPTVQCQRGKRRLRRQRSSLSFAPNLVRLAQGDGAGEGVAVGEGEGVVGPILAGNCNGNNNNGCCCCCCCSRVVAAAAVAYYWLGLVKSFVMFLSWCPVTLICCRKCNFWHRGCRLLCLPATVAVVAVVVIVIVIGCIQWTSPGDVIRWRTSRGKWKLLELSVGALQ